MLNINVLFCKPLINKDMIRHDSLISTVRFYDTETDDPFYPYVAICTIVWESPDVIWVKGLHGDLSRKLLREFLKFLVDSKIKTVKAHRANGKTLPFIVFRDNEYTEISVESLAKKFIKDSD